MARLIRTTEVNGHHIQIRAFGASQSDCMPDAPEARDVSVELVIDGGVTISGEVTLLPHECTGRLGAWGAPDNWISSSLLREINARFDGHDFSDVLKEISAVASDEAEDV